MPKEPAWPKKGNKAFLLAQDGESFHPATSHGDGYYLVPADCESTRRNCSGDLSSM